MKLLLVAYGTFPARPGWTSADDARPKGEPLVRSVRAYLEELEEPREIVVRVVERDASDLNNNPGQQQRQQLQQQQQQPEMPSTAERLQRQPLLGPDKQPTHTVLLVDDSDQDERPRSPHQTFPNGDLQLVESAREDRFPREIPKTALSFAFSFVCVCVNMCSLSIVHDWVPDRREYRPLPDVFLERVPAMDWALSVSEYIIMMTTTTGAIVIVMHKHRFIVIRRVFFLLGLLYLYRSLTMFVTVLPVSSATYYCSPKANGTVTPSVIVERMVYLMSGFGLSVNGRHTYCGDYIYSGHTTVLVLGYLVISEYIPRKLRALHWLFFCTSVTGVVFLLLAHGHYTVDVVIAYYISTRLFWTYHSMTRQHSRQANAGMIAREWWYPMFLYFERNVRAPVPRQYDWPLPRPKCFVKFFNRLS